MMKKIAFLLASCFLVTLSTYSQSVQQLHRLIEIKENSETSFKKKKKEAQKKAGKMGIPIRQETEDGEVMELMFFVGDQPYYYITDNADAARTVSTDQIQPNGASGFDLDGNTEELGVWDASAVYEQHQEFVGRVIVPDLSEPIGFRNHATHVAGTMAAAGVNPEAMGMAPAATILSYDWNNDEAEMAAAAANGLFVSNHSYGFGRGWVFDGRDERGEIQWEWFGDPSISPVEDYLFGFYDFQAQQWDELANNAPYYLIVRAAGNDRNDGRIDNIEGREVDGGDDGFDCISHAGVSKNILTVGAVNAIPGGYNAPEDVVMSGFSSWGPTDDGRIKPDLVANGVGVFSPVAHNGEELLADLYRSSNGTSMASPNAAGSIGLLLQQQRNVYGDVMMRSSTMKGLLIHTTDEAGPNPGPDYMFGWGLPNFRRAAELIETSGNNCLNINEYDIVEDQVIEIPVVKAAGEELKVTICWNDPAGNPTQNALNPRDVMLVNDFDVRVIGGNATHSPWILDVENPANAATQGDNILDNVEQVVVNNNDNDIYIVRISHKGTLLNNSQIVSVIISGNEEISVTQNVDNLLLKEDRYFWAQENINSTSTIIDEGADVNFFSGKSISLKNGFSAKTGSYFNAKTDASLVCSDWSSSLRLANNSSYERSSRFVYERNILPKSTNQNETITSNADLSSLDADGFRIFPNPSSTGIFQVEFRESISKSIEIFDVSGRLVYSNNNSFENKVQLDLSDSKKGLYIVKLVFDDEVVTRRLVLN